MSLHYLLDGYNVLKQMPSLRDLPLEDGRKGLLGWIGAIRPQGSMNNRVTVVFDGHPDYSGGSPEGEVSVIFSDGCTADDKIKRMVDEDDDRKSCVVVSDDKDVFLYARSLGARVMSVARFTRADSTRRPVNDPDGKNISLSRQEKINKELGSIWLKEKP
jgi:predicted RNA-binding protein with PIN domain